MNQPQIRKYLYLKAGRMHIPLSGSFELTPRCNMNCKMCYIRMSKHEQTCIGRERTAEEWIALGQVCKREGLLFLLLTGGEPFLREDFRQIYEGLYDMDLMISINTNGTLLTPEMISWLKEKPPVKVNVTLYGGSEDTYEKLCGYRDGYSRAKTAIEMLKEAGIKVSVNVGYINENIEEFDCIHSFIKECNLPHRMTTYMFPPVRKKEYEKQKQPYRLSPKQAGYMMFKNDTYDMDENDLENKKKKIISGVSEQTEECVRDDKMRCMAGRSSFWITWDWQMRGCGMMTAPSVETSPDKFLDSWRLLGEEIDHLRFPKACSECEFRSVCMVCGAIVQAEGDGDMDKQPQYVCEMVQEYMKQIMTLKL